MTEKTIESNKIDIQNRQDAIDAERVDKYLINNSNSKKIILAYYIDQKVSLNKKVKACNRETVQIEVKPKNNLVIQLNLLYKNAAFSYSKRTTRNRNKANPVYHAKYNSRYMQDI